MFALVGVWSYVDVQPIGRYAMLPAILRVLSELRPSNVPGSSDVRPVSEKERSVSFVVKLNTLAGSDVRPALL